MATDPFKQVLYNDGEGLTFGDLNNAENFNSAIITDQIIESMAGNFSLTSLTPNFPGLNTDLATHLAYTLNGGSAYLQPGSATNKVRISQGVLFQKLSAKTGLTSTLMPFYFDGSASGEFTIAAGDSVNPRVDLLQMALAYTNTGSTTRDFKDATTGVVTSQTMFTTRQTTCTLSVKQGVAAVSPQVPDPDAGYVAVGSIVVGTSYLTTTALLFGQDNTGAIAVVHDQRMPLRVSAVTQLPSQSCPIAGWTQGATNLNIAATNTTNELWWRSFRQDNFSRLVGIYSAHDDNGWSFYPYLKSRSGSPGFTNVNCNRLPIFAFGQAYTLVPYYTLDGAHFPTNGPTIIASAVNKIGAPLWSSGLRVAVPHSLTTNYELYLQMVSGNNTAFVATCTFFWAG